jgi:hypothetical protein
MSNAPALVLALVIAGGITTALLVAHRGDNKRRGWIMSGLVTAVLVAIGAVDLLRESPRETHFATLVFGAGLPVLGATGLIQATRQVRPWIRWLLVFAVTVVLLFAGLVIGATVLPRWLPS